MHNIPLGAIIVLFGVCTFVWWGICHLKDELYDAPYQAVAYLCITTGFCIFMFFVMIYGFATGFYSIGQGVVVEFRTIVGATRNTECCKEPFEFIIKG